MKTLARLSVMMPLLAPLVCAAQDTTVTRAPMFSYPWKENGLELGYHFAFPSGGEATSLFELGFAHARINRHWSDVLYAAVEVGFPGSGVLLGPKVGAFVSFFGMLGFGGELVCYTDLIQSAVRPRAYVLVGNDRVWFSAGSVAGPVDASYVPVKRFDLGLNYRF